MSRSRTNGTLMVWDKSPNSPKQVETFRYNQKAVEKLKALSG